MTVEYPLNPWLKKVRYFRINILKKTQVGRDTSFLRKKKKTSPKILHFRLFTSYK